MFRHLTGKQNQYFVDCQKSDSDKTPFRLVGDAYGKPAKMGWTVRQTKSSKGGGPFQWFHIYYR